MTLSHIARAIALQVIVFSYFTNICSIMFFGGTVWSVFSWHADHRATLKLDLTGWETDQKACEKGYAPTFCVVSSLWQTLI